MEKVMARSHTFKACAEVFGFIEASRAKMIMSVFWVTAPFLMG
jgi:hypothetical protein